MEKMHCLDGEERLVLEIATLLHDIGHFINTIDHDQHGYYILKVNISSVYPNANRIW